MCTGMIACLIGLLDNLGFRYRCYVLRREAREAVERLEKCYDYQRRVSHESNVLD